MSWVEPRVCEEIFLLRLGMLISSGDHSSESADSMIAGLLAGLKDDTFEESARVPVHYLIHGGDPFSREQFRLPGTSKDPAKQQLRWKIHQQAFVEIARQEWLAELRHPSVTLIGLYMILRSVEGRLASPHEKVEKYAPNLLDYLNPTAIERLILRECRDFFGLNRQRAAVMCDAFPSLIRWSARQGLITKTEIDRAEKPVMRLREKIG